ncbi:hypothetical protein SVAN01_07845 [Stagonosporopsis vannaccii]|nr:hypothetical protein SVAN01_07845 [Stagonosporopsis vannaccii]
MCYYHAYSHKCGHTECILQKLCPKGQMIQQKCGRGREGIIMATVEVETRCDMCKKVCQLDNRNRLKADKVVNLRQECFDLQLGCGIRRRAISSLHDQTTGVAHTWC